MDCRQPLRTCTVRHSDSDLVQVTASRATLGERTAGFFGVILAAGLTIALLDKSMMGPAMLVLTIPVGIAAFALGAIFCHRMLSFRRTVVALLMAFAGFGTSTADSL